MSAGRKNNSDKKDFLIKKIGTLLQNISLQSNNSLVVRLI